MDDIHARIASRVHALRQAQGLSLDALAGRSGVSRSHISLIERGQSSPTATVLDKLTAALGVTLASLFEESRDAQAPAPSPLARVAEQPLWRDPASGYLRRQVSPAAPSAIQLVDVVFPAGRRVAYDSGPRAAEVHQQVWMIEGEMEIRVGDTPWHLQAGDCLAMRLDQPVVFRNPTTAAARYLVALALLPAVGTRTSP